MYVLSVCVFVCLSVCMYVLSGSMYCTSFSLARQVWHELPVCLFVLCVCLSVCLYVHIGIYMYYFLHSCSPVFYLCTLAFVHADVCVCVCTIAAIVSLIFKFRVKHNNLQYKRHYLVIGSFVIQCISFLCIGGPYNNVYITFPCVPACLCWLPPVNILECTYLYCLSVCTLEIFYALAVCLSHLKEGHPIRGKTSSFELWECSKYIMYYYNACVGKGKTNVLSFSTPTSTSWYWRTQAGWWLMSR